MMRRYVQLSGVLVALVVSSWFCASSFGQSEADSVVKRTVLGFDADNDHYLIKIEQDDTETSFLVRDVDTQKTVGARSASSRAEEKSALKRMRRKHKIGDDALEGQVSPDEQYTIMGAPTKDGKGYRVMVMKGARIGQLKRIELSEDTKAKKAASGILKQVVWSKDGKLLTVVVTEKLITRHQSFEKDRVIPIRFRSWKIRWMPPPKVPAETK